MSPSPVAPQIVGDVTFTKNTPEEGESTTATCRWTGEPEPTVTWYKDGKELVEAEVPDHIRIVMTMKDGEKRSELQIEKVEIGDAGNYACNVSNPVGSDSQTKRLEVEVQGMYIIGLGLNCCKYSPKGLHLPLHNKLLLHIQILIQTLPHQKLLHQTLPHQTLPHQTLPHHLPAPELAVSAQRLLLLSCSLQWEQ